MAFSTQKQFYNMPYQVGDPGFICQRDGVNLKRYESTVDDRAWDTDENKKTRFLTDLVKCKPDDPDSNALPRRSGADGDYLPHTRSKSQTPDSKSKDLQKDLSICKSQLKDAKQENDRLKKIMQQKVNKGFPKELEGKVNKLLKSGKLNKGEEEGWSCMPQKAEDIYKANEVLSNENKELKRMLEKLSRRITLDCVNLSPENSQDISYLQDQVNRLRKEVDLLRQKEDNQNKNQTEYKDPACLKQIIQERDELRLRCEGMKNLENQLCEMQKRERESRQQCQKVSSELNCQMQHCEDMECKMKEMQRYYEDKLQQCSFNEEMLKCRLKDIKTCLTQAQCEISKNESLIMEVGMLRNELVQYQTSLSEYDCQYRQLMCVVDELKQKCHDQDGGDTNYKQYLDDLAYFTSSALCEIMKEFQRRGITFDSSGYTPGSPGGGRPGVAGTHGATAGAGDDSCWSQLEDLKKQMQALKEEKGNLQGQISGKCDDLCADALKKLRELEAENNRLNQIIQQRGDKPDELANKLKNMEDKLNCYNRMAEAIGAGIEDCNELLKRITDLQRENKMVQQEIDRTVAGTIAEKGGAPGDKTGGAADRGPGAGEKGPGAGDKGPGTGGEKGPGAADKGPSGADKGPGGADKGPGGADKGPGGADKGPDGADKGPGGADKGPGGADKGPAGADKGPGTADKGAAGADKGPAGADKGPGAADKGAAGADKGPGAADKGAAGADKGPGAADKGAAGADKGPGAADKGAAGGEKGPGAADKGAAGADKGPAGADKGAAGGEKGPGAADKGAAGADKGPGAAEKTGAGEKPGAADKGPGAADKGPGAAGKGPEGAADKGPGAAGKGPEGAADKGPGAAGTGQGAAGTGPGAAGTGPGAAGTGPGAAGTGPGAPGTGPGAAGRGPGAAGTGPGAAGTGPGAAGTGTGAGGGETDPTMGGQAGAGAGGKEGVDGGGPGGRAGDKAGGGKGKPGAGPGGGKGAGAFSGTGTGAEAGGGPGTQGKGSKGKGAYGGRKTGEESFSAVDDGDMAIEAISKDPCADGGKIGNDFEGKLQEILDSFIRECGFCSCKTILPKSKFLSLCHKIIHHGISCLAFKELYYMVKKLFAASERIYPGIMLIRFIDDFRLKELLGQGANEFCQCQEGVCRTDSEEMLKIKLDKLENEIFEAKEYLDRFIPKENESHGHHRASMKSPTKTKTFTPRAQGAQCKYVKIHPDY